MTLIREDLCKDVNLHFYKDLQKLLIFIIYFITNCIIDSAFFFIYFKNIKNKGTYENNN